MISRIPLVVAALFLAVGLVCGTASAQELTPRAYWPTPNGTNVFILAYQKSTGDIVVDASLPVTGVDSDIDYLQVGYQRTFGLWGRTTNINLSVPISQGETEGFVDGLLRRRETSGFGDVRLRFAINLKGAPTMDVAGFRAMRENLQTIVGASVLVQMPTGAYDPDKIINVGTNRWSIKPAVGVIWPMHPKWLLEFEVGAWFFGDNDEFLGETREQDPVLSTEVHLIRQIRSGFWASLDANYYVGGRTNIGDTEQANLQRNSRVGITMVFPIRGKHALRGSFSTGVATASGGDFKLYNLSYLYAW